MSIRYVATVLDNLPDLSATEALVLVALADYTSDDTRECWPSIATIARRARCDRRTAQRRLRGLEARGLIETATGGHQYGRNAASRYRLKFDYSGELVPDVEPLEDLSTRAAERRGGAAPATGKGGAHDREGRRSAAPSVIEPSLIQRGDKSPSAEKAKRRDVRELTDAELEERARAGKLTASEERERELRRRMRQRKAAP